MEENRSITNPAIHFGCREIIVIIIIFLNILTNAEMSIAKFILYFNLAASGVVWVKKIIKVYVYSRCETEPVPGDHTSVVLEPQGFSRYTRMLRTRFSGYIPSMPFL